MDGADVAEALEEAFKAQWGGRTLIKWENLGPMIPVGSEPYAVFCISDMDGRTVAINGNKLTRVYGMLAIQIIAPRGLGTKTSRQYADQALAVFQKQSFAGGAIKCRSGSVRLESRDNDQEVQFGVYVPFHFDQ